MDAVCMQALHDRFRLVSEAVDGSTVNDDVSGCDGFALVQPPDMEFVDRLDAGDLRNCQQGC